MTPAAATRQTTVGAIAPEVLAFTAGQDIELDAALVDADCIGSAAHVIMLSRLPVRPRLFTRRDRIRVVAELVGIMRRARQGKFRITIEDQDVHLAVERELTARLGDLGKKVHTARSRNDQVAVDLRLFGKEQLLAVADEVLVLAGVLVGFARRHARVPMVGRTHMQPAMPSSVGLWASACAESLLDDLTMLRAAYAVNDQCPLGSAASYGVPLPIDRRLVSDLLGFARPIHNVLHANQSRGKVESVILSVMSQIMLTLSRLAQDLLLFTMPEFGYFTLPREMCTGSSIMPQKNNPDVLELVRARAARVLADTVAVTDVVKSLPGGYNRDLQETKEPFFEGVRQTRACLRILAPLVLRLGVNPDALRAGFTPAVYATDRALELVGRGMPFRDAYHHVKTHLDELGQCDPDEAIARKIHLGGTAGLDWTLVRRQVAAERRWVTTERRRYLRAVARLLRAPYPLR